MNIYVKKVNILKTIKVMNFKFNSTCICNEMNILIYEWLKQQKYSDIVSMQKKKKEKRKTIQ